MKNVEAVKQKMKDVEAEDFLGFIRQDLIGALSFEDAKAGDYVNDGVTEEQWNEQMFKTDADVIAKMKSYLTFAYDKANGQRGLSANRSVMHFQAWSFLVDDGLHEWINNAYKTNYAEYGIPILDHIKEWLEKQN